MNCCFKQELKVFSFICTTYFWEYVTKIISAINGLLTATEVNVQIGKIYMNRAAVIPKHLFPKYRPANLSELELQGTTHSY